jgi:hypothetical protein
VVLDLVVRAGASPASLTGQARASGPAVQLPVRPVASLARRAVDLAALSAPVTVED